MSAKWKPSKSQCELIMQAAALIVGKGVGAVFLEAGMRGDASNISLNDLLLNDGETDLVDFVDWSTFKKGVPVTEDGQAQVDFYIRPKRVVDDTLLSNLIVQVLDGEIMYLTENGTEGYCYIKDAERAIKAKPAKVSK